MTGLVTIRDIRAAGEQEIHKSSHFGLCSQSRCDRPPGHACCQEAKTNWHSETLSETHKNQLHKSLQVSPYEEMLCRTDMELTSAYMGKTLNSWKEIAVYLGRGVRTAQRWELQQTCLYIELEAAAEARCLLSKRNWMSGFAISLAKMGKTLSHSVHSRTGTRTRTKPWKASPGSSACSPGNRSRTVLPVSATDL